MKIDRTRKKLFYILSLIVLIVIFLIGLKCCYSKPDSLKSSLDTIQTETTDKYLEFEPAADNPINSITIPGVTGLSMKSDQLQQKVDFFNPEENNCYFVISIYLSDDTLIYKSDYLAPAESITKITLLQTLQKGTYKNCRMVYNCYTLDGKAALNSGTVIFEINSY